MKEERCPKCKSVMVFVKGLGHACDCPLEDCFDIHTQADNRKGDD